MCIHEKRLDLDSFAVSPFPRPSIQSHTTGVGEEEKKVGRSFSCLSPPIKTAPVALQATAN